MGFKGDTEVHEKPQIHNVGVPTGCSSADTVDPGDSFRRFRPIDASILDMSPKIASTLNTLRMKSRFLAALSTSAGIPSELLILIILAAEILQTAGSNARVQRRKLKI